MYKKLVSYWNKNTYLDYILIAIVASHTLLWFQDGMLYFQGDAGIPYNPTKNLSMLYAWWERQAGFESWGFSQILIIPFFALLEKLGVSLVASQDIYIYLARAVAGCSMYYLSSAFTTSRFVNLLSALIYLFSPFQLGLITIYVYLPYVFMPLILGLYIKGLNNKSKAHLLLSAIALIVLTCDFPNYRHYLIAIALLMLYSSYYALFYSRETKDSIKYALRALILVGLTNILLTLWISLPIYSLLAGAGVGNMLANIGIDFGDYGWATILNVIRLRGSASLESGGATYAGSLLENPILIISSFYLPVIAFALLLFRRKLDRSVYFLLVVIVLFLFIAKGTNTPLGGIYKWVVLHVPFARAFRTSWLSILPVVMAYSILASISAHLIYQCLSEKKKLYGYCFIAFSVAMILLPSYPLITGGYIQSTFSPTKSGGYLIPRAYYEMEKYLSENLPTGSRFMRIPESGGYINMFHSWNYAGSNITPFIFSEHSYIDGYMLANSASAILNRLYEKIRNYQFDNEFESLLRMFNIRYILIDGYEESDKFYSKIPQVKNRLLQNRRITFVKQVDGLYLYKFDNDIISTY